MRTFFDSDILIDFLQGSEEAAREVGLYPSAHISRITWIEVMTGTEDEDEAKAREGLLASFEIAEITEGIARETVFIRRKYRLKLPDALIWATARCHDGLLVTRNSKDFPRYDPGIRIPYKR